jgi:RNA polymerase sigma-70 factor (ECF subfamily)
LEDLMAGYQRDEPNATAELVDRISPRILRYFARAPLIGSYAEDLSQEFFLRIHKARSSYRPGMQVLPWVFGIARHTKVDGYRSLMRTGLLRDVPLDGHADSIPCPHTLDGELDAIRLIERLPEGQRQVILMLKIGGMKLNEVAGASGSSLGAVKQKAHRGYCRLRSLATESGSHITEIR